MEFIKNIVCEILKQLQRLLFLVPVNNRKILFSHIMELTIVI